MWTCVTKKMVGVFCMYIGFPHGLALVEDNIESVFLDRVTVELGSLHHGRAESVESIPLRNFPKRLVSVTD